MSWGMAKATNPSDAVTGHRPLQMISQIFVDMSHSKYVQHEFTVHHGFIPSACWTICFWNTMQLYIAPTIPNPPQFLVLMLVRTAAVLREKASLARADLLPDARWGMRLDGNWWIFIANCFCRSRANDHFCPICVFSFAMHLNERKLSHDH